MDELAKELKTQIIELVEEYYTVSFSNSEFVLGKTLIPYAGRVFDHDELVHLAETDFDFWLTAGCFADQLERQFYRFRGTLPRILAQGGYIQ